MAAGETDCEPLVDCTPDQAPPAVQDVAFVEDQLSVAVAPAEMPVGKTLTLAVGGGGGGGGVVTVTMAVTGADDPPGPVQVSVYVAVAVGETGCEPLVGRLPDQAPPAAHEFAFVDDQERLEDWPTAMLVGLALNDAVGSGA